MPRSRFCEPVIRVDLFRRFSDTGRRNGSANVLLRGSSEPYPTTNLREICTERVLCDPPYDTFSEGSPGCELTRLESILNSYSDGGPRPEPGDIVMYVSVLGARCARVRRNSSRDADTAARLEGIIGSTSELAGIPLEEYVGTVMEADEGEFVTSDSPVISVDFSGYTDCCDTADVVKEHETAYFCPVSPSKCLLVYHRGSEIARRCAFRVRTSDLCDRMVLQSRDYIVSRRRISDRYIGLMNTPIRDLLPF